MNVHISIKTAQNDAGKKLAAQLRKLANQVEDWPGANEFTLGVLDDERKNVGRLAAIFDSCPNCQDRPGYNGLGKTCRTCKGIGRLSPGRKTEVGL